MLFGNRVAGAPPSPSRVAQGNLTLRALTEPDVTSVHSALIAQPVPREIASEQTVWGQPFLLLIDYNSSL